ncbi:MAG TPA: hypothetical protein VHH10_13925 [Rubrobacteraceae bacterium]|jgi:hypothetical protein|nr:hypothetical protein [Rubrobacteraceae bacterium]
MFGSDARPHGTITTTFYAPSLAVSRYACGWYGVGHTNRRQPGEMRGTVIGKEGRFKFLAERR